jgi:hypothetical protein
MSIPSARILDAAFLYPCAPSGDRHTGFGMGDSRHECRGRFIKQIDENTGFGLLPDDRNQHRAVDHDHPGNPRSS